MFDAERFIQHVRSRPSIWNKQREEYADRVARDNSWIEIAEMMFDDWEGLGRKLKEVRVREMKQKWRHIRDSYTKYLHQGPSARKRRRYLYADHLEFLAEVIQKREGFGGVKQEEDYVQEEDNDGESDFNSPIETLLMNNMSWSSGEDQVKTGHQEEVVGSCARHHELSKFEAELVKKLVPSTKLEDEDPDRAFMMSIVPDYKKLSDEDKLDFRITVLQYFRANRSKSSQSSQPKVEGPGIPLNLN